MKAQTRFSRVFVFCIYFRRLFESEDSIYNSTEHLMHSVRMSKTKTKMVTCAYWYADLDMFVDCCINAFLIFIFSYRLGR